MKEIRCPHCGNIFLEKKPEPSVNCPLNIPGCNHNKKIEEWSPRCQSDAVLKERAESIERKRSWDMHDQEIRERLAKQGKRSPWLDG